MPSPYSYSSLTKFETCPAQYAHKYVWKTQIPEEEMRLDLPMTTGSIVHGALEHTHLQLKDGKPMDWESIQPHLTELWAKALAESPQPIPEEELAPFLEKSRATTKWYFDTILRAEKEPTIGIEKKLLYPLNPGRKQWMIGYVDRVSQPSESKIVLHDYKTGAKNLSEKTLSKDFQASLYGAMAAHTYQPLTEIELRWHFLSEQKTVKATLDPEHARAAVQKAQRLAMGIEDHKAVGLFPARVGWACSRCDFASVCPAFKAKNG